ncbi:DUF3099 domain-containing protein [Propioniciclava flava]
MAGRGAEDRPSVITGARIGRTLSTEQRMRRYLITMGFRVVAFFAAVLSPAPYNIALFIAAALLPGLAVLLGNAADNHAAPVARPLEVAPLPELTGRDVIPGDVAESDAA